MTAADHEPTFVAQDRLIDAAWQQVVRVRSTAASGTDPHRPRVAANLPETIPGYRITGEIHRGAQGVVYRAIQESTRRTVAIKVMLHGPFAGPHERARFRREVEILAQLRHPNIVAIHDSGKAGDAFYFVMAYIAGYALDEYVAARTPTLRERLRLFGTICDAVNTAHLRGVMHRDLKPSNIRIDDQGVPHVLDFGLAKHTALQEMAEFPTAVTTTGQFIGSLPWASPEQAQGRSGDVDLRTDVYALGVMLFQLLTGRFPYEVTGSLGQTLNNIIHVDPRPPRALNRALDDELNTIALKALRKDPEQRYQTAGALGEDIRRYLAGEPIEAKRESTGYLLRKHLKRHRVPAALGAAFFTLILVGFGVSSFFWRQAIIARNQEENQKNIAMHNEVLAETRAARASAEAAKARAISAFLTTMLSAASPVFGSGGDVTVRDALQAARDRLQRDPFERPEVEAGVRHAIGRTYATLGEYDTALEELEAARDLFASNANVAPQDVLDLHSDLGHLLRRRGDLDGAERSFELILRSVPETEADAPYFQALGTLGLAGVLRERGEAPRAIELIESVLPAFREHPRTAREDVANVLNDLGLAYQAVDNLDGALAAGREALAIYEEMHGPRHYTVAVCKNNLARLYVEQLQFAEAEALYQTALAIFHETAGPKHPTVASARGSLGRCYLKQRRYAEAVEQFEASLALRLEVLGAEHPLIINSRNNLAAAQYHLGALRDSAANAEEALRLFRALRGAEHPAQAPILTNLGDIYRTLGEHDRAAPLLREALRMRRAQLGPDHPRACDAAEALATLELEIGSADEAAAMISAALAGRRARQGAEHPHTLAAEDKLARALLALEALDRAEVQCRATLARRLPTAAERPLDVADSYATLGCILLARVVDPRAELPQALATQPAANDEDEPRRSNILAEASQCFAEADAHYAARLPDDHFRRALVQRDRALILALRGEHDAAQALAARACAALRASLGEQHPETRRAVAVQDVVRSGGASACKLSFSAAPGALGYLPPSAAASAPPSSPCVVW